MDTYKALNRTAPKDLIALQQVFASAERYKYLGNGYTINIDGIHSNPEYEDAHEFVESLMTAIGDNPGDLRWLLFELITASINKTAHSIRVFDSPITKLTKIWVSPGGWHREIKSEVS